MTSYCRTGIGCMTIAVFLCGCAAEVPSVKVWRPWTREISTTETVSPTAKIKTQIMGETLPLLGDEKLTSDRIMQKLDFLLQRRGFSIAEESPNYHLTLSYKTERKDKPVSLSTFESYGATGQILGSAASGYGLGIDLARQVQWSLVRSGQMTTEMPGYTHTISVEICNETGDLIWKGESTWDSGNIDIIADILPGLQIVLSYLPCEPGIKPAVE